MSGSLLICGECSLLCCSLFSSITTWLNFQGSVACWVADLIRTDFLDWDLKFWRLCCPVTFDFCVTNTIKGHLQRLSRNGLGLAVRTSDAAIEVSEQIVWTPTASFRMITIVLSSRSFNFPCFRRRNVCFVAGRRWKVIWVQFERRGAQVKPEWKVCLKGLWVMVVNWLWGDLLRVADSGAWCRSSSGLSVWWLAVSELMWGRPSGASNAGLSTDRCLSQLGSVLSAHQICPGLINTDQQLRHLRSPGLPVENWIDVLVYLFMQE